MPPGALVTRWFIGLVIAAIVAYDVAIIQLYGKPASISEVLYQWSADNPIIPFAIGAALAGHCFWKQ